MEVHKLIWKVIKPFAELKLMVIVTPLGTMRIVEFQEFEILHPYENVRA